MLSYCQTLRRNGVAISLFWLRVQLTYKSITKFENGFDQHFSEIFSNDAVYFGPACIGLASSLAYVNESSYKPTYDLADNTTVSLI